MMINHNIRSIKGQLCEYKFNVCNLPKYWFMSWNDTWSERLKNFLMTLLFFLGSWPHSFWEPESSDQFALNQVVDCQFYFQILPTCSVWPRIVCTDSFFRQFFCWKALDGLSGRFTFSPDKTGSHAQREWDEGSNNQINQLLNYFRMSMNICLLLYQELYCQPNHQLSSALTPNHFPSTSVVVSCFSTH